MLTAMGLGPDRAMGAVRLSLGRWTTADDVLAAADAAGRGRGQVSVLSRPCPARRPGSRRGPGRTTGRSCGQYRASRPPPRSTSRRGPTSLPRRAWVRPTQICARPCHRSRSCSGAAFQRASSTSWAENGRPCASSDLAAAIVSCGGSGSSDTGSTPVGAVRERAPEGVPGPGLPRAPGRIAVPVVAHPANGSSSGRGSPVGRRPWGVVAAQESPRSVPKRHRRGGRRRTVTGSRRASGVGEQMGGEERGWVASAGPSDWTLEPSPGLAPSSGGVRPGADGEPVRPELADLARLGRRALRKVVHAARSDMGPTLARALRAHLGPLDPGAPVVSESWRPYDHVNVQAGLEAWLAEPGRQYEVVGVTAFQNREFGLADFLDETGPVDPWGPRPGNVATVNVPCGPDSAVRACVACAIYLVADGRGPVSDAAAGPRADGMHPEVTLEVVSTEPGVAARIAAEVRQSALQHNVFRGQVLSFGGEMFGPDSSVLSFHRRPDWAGRPSSCPPG